MKMLPRDYSAFPRKCYYVLTIISPSNPHKTGSTFLHTFLFFFFTSHKSVEGEPCYALWQMIYYSN